MVVEIPDTNKGKLKRRSSVARSIRLSLSATGLPDITFQQQLVASLNKNSPVEDKLRRILTLAHKVTMKTLQQENEQLEVGNPDSEDLKADTVDHLVKELGRKNPINASFIDNSKHKLMSYKKNSDHKIGNVKENKISTTQSSRLRTLRQYQDGMNTEINNWDELLQQRKNKYSFAKLECSMVEKGEKKITNSHKARLPRLEEAWLRGLSDGRAEMNRLNKQEVMQKLCKESIHKRMAQKRKSLEDKNIELEQTAKKIANYAAEKFKDRLSEIDREVMTKIRDETIKWLDATQLAEVDEFRDIQKEVESQSDTKLYAQAAPGGMSGGRPGGMQGRMSNGSGTGGPAIEEVH